MNRVHGVNEYKFHYAKYSSFADISDSGYNCLSGSEDRGVIIIDDNSTEEQEVDDENTLNQIFRGKLRQWAVEHGINRMALKDLLKIVKERFEKGKPFLPEDPRTLLQTPQIINVVPISGGEYWHQGLANCLKEIFRNLNEPLTISLNINIDGLPLYKSSKVEFWPILFNLAEMPHVSPMSIGIFCGKAKTSDVDSFLTPFVNEMDEIMRNGMWINSHKITVRIRCFVCDSPARAYVKGK